MYRNTMVSDQEKAGYWAFSLLERTDWVILDTETTGLSQEDEIIQIAILAFDGAVLLDTLVHPTQPIPPSATLVHGIRNVDVKDAPHFPEIFERIKKIIKGKTIVIYNAAFDLRLIQQTMAKYGLPSTGINEEQVDCAMLQYSAWIGELWPEGGYKWQKLRGGNHTALGDCRATLRVIQEMARRYKEKR